jgi:predicted ATPase
MLKQVQVKGFKSLGDLRVDLAPLVVLFGPNAAGKSNLLDAIGLFSRLVTERTLADAFSPPLRGYPIEAFTLPEAGLEGLHAQREARMELGAVLSPLARNGPRPSGLAYRVGVRIVPATGALTVFDERLVRLKKDGSEQDLPRIECADGQLVVRRVGEQGQPRREPLGLNHTLVSNLQFTGDKYPDFDRLRGEIGSWRSYYLDPRVAMREAQPPREVTDIGSLGQWLAPFLFRLKESPEHSKRFQAVRRALHSAIPTLHSLDVDLDRARGVLDIRVVQDGTPFSSRVISEGTLRVLALCAIAVNPWAGSLVAFEEPENGVHCRRIEVIADLLHRMATEGGQQVVVTTHSPTLVAAMVRKQRLDSDAIRLLACHRDGRVTGVRPFDSSGRLFDDQEIAAGLRDDSEDALIEALLRRGWLDG